MKRRINKKGSQHRTRIKRKGSNDNEKEEK